jgi:hypothetical protein
MDTVEYSGHVARIGKNIRRIAENVESAADNEIEGAEREAAIEQARARLADYDAVIAKLATDSKTLLGQFTKRFEDDIGLVRESLERIDAKSGEATSK